MNETNNRFLEGRDFLKEIIKELSIKNFMVLFIAGVINAIGVTMFLAPVHLYDSGISGTSMLLWHISPPYLTLSFFLLILNVPLFIFGYKRQGSIFTIYSIFTVCIFSFAAYLITYVFPIDVSHYSPFAKEDLFLCAIFGGIISGVGSGLTIRFGGAIDGVDVLAVTFAKRMGISVGCFVMIYNVILYVVVGIILQKWILSLYSIVTYAAALKTIDFIVDGLDKAKSAMIITAKEKEICKALSKEFGSGVTVIEAKGFYSSEKKSVIYFVVNRFQVVKLKKIIKEQDREAFISIGEISEVLCR